MPHCPRIKGSGENRNCNTGSWLTQNVQLVQRRPETEAASLRDRRNPSPLSRSAPEGWRPTLTRILEWTKGNPERKGIGEPGDWQASDGSR
jgi:hypothetical protein